jgi:hypothetical protein
MLRYARRGRVILLMWLDRAILPGSRSGLPRPAGSRHQRRGAKTRSLRRRRREAAPTRHRRPLDETVLGGGCVRGHDENSFPLPAAEVRAAIDVKDVTRDHRGVVRYRTASAMSWTVEGPWCSSPGQTGLGHQTLRWRLQSRNRPAIARPRPKVRPCNFGSRKRQEPEIAGLGCHEPSTRHLPLGFSKRY